jgi:hypothetical protein
MDEADLSQVEERLMSELNLYEELLILEDEIIDRYVRNQMSEADRASFESYFLQSSEHREKLRFARALSKYVDRATAEVGNIEPEAVAPDASAELDNLGRVYAPAKSRHFSFWPFQSPALNFGLAVVVVIAIAGLGWMALRSVRPTGPGNVFEVALLPGGISRDGGQMQTISIPPGTNTLRLHLALPAEQYRDYKIDLLASDSSLAFNRDNLAPHSANSAETSLVVDIPANRIRPDSYRLKLSGRSTGAYEGIATYNFRVLVGQR